MITTALIIACASFWITDYLPEFLDTGKLFKIKPLKGLTAQALEILKVKPFSCTTCTSIWLSIIFTLTINIDFIYYIALVPILSEGISRWIKE